MPEPTSRHRTADRDWQIWQRYLGGETQRALAKAFGLNQSTISDIIARLRTDVPIEERRARQMRALADMDELREVALRMAHEPGTVRDPELPLKAIDRIVRMAEREAKALGTDAPSRVSVEAEALGAEILAMLGQSGGDET